MSKKVLYVDPTSGFYTEATVYETSDHVSVSAGAADAGKPIVLDAGGLIDASMIDDSDIDHGNLTGLADDDHTQYILVAGTRAFTGDQSMGTNQLTDLGDPTATTIDAASDDAVPMSFLASTASGEGASKIGIQDSADYFTAVSVEGALAELAAALPGNVSFTVGTGGVTKGDLVYISAANTVRAHATLTNDFYGVGLAQATVAAAGTVIVASDDEVLTGVLTGATAGNVYYWTGSALSTSIPSGANANVWRVGVAKNATDLYTDVKPIKKNGP